MTIDIGLYARTPNEDENLTITTDDVNLKRQVKQPWFRAYIRKHLGRAAQARLQQTPGRAVISDFTADRHILLCGSTGYGKSRFLEHVVMEHIRQGHSVAILDQKVESHTCALAAAYACGLPPERVWVLSPGQAEGIPGWNPMSVGLPMSQVAGDLVAVLHESSRTSWGPRLEDLLTNALIVLGEHGLSIYELARFLTSDDYRANLLLAPKEHPCEQSAYFEAFNFFRAEFAVWGKGERASSVGPVLNKIRELLRSPYLSALFCARQSSLDLARLWQGPGLLLVHLDRTVLGDGARLLAGLLSTMLLRTALRSTTRSATKCLLAIDELGSIEKYIGPTLAETVALARGFDLRLLLACQHLAQLSDEVLGAILANAGVKALFRLGAADARLVAASLVGGREPVINQVAVSSERTDRQTGKPPLATWSHLIRDSYGQKLELSQGAWAALWANDLFGSNAVQDLKAIAEASGVSRLYVRCPESRQMFEIEQYLRGLPGSEFWVTGPVLKLTVSFPRPQIRVVERTSEADAVRRFARTLQELAPQQIVFKAADQPLGVVKVRDVPDMHLTEAHRQYLAAALAANGQSAQEIADCRAWREAEVARIAQGAARPRSRTAGKERTIADDGSLA